MAGIGFRLNKYFSDDSSVSRVKGAFYSIVLSSGPWLISILSIAIISLYARQWLVGKELLVFKSIISYTYAGSLILFGMIELPLTRYISDKIYHYDVSTFRRVFFTVISICVASGAVLGYLFYYFVPIDLYAKVGGVLFLISVLSTWVGMVFLSAAKGYGKIIASFVGGGILSLVFSTILGKSFGLTGFIFGYALGIWVLALSLSILVYVEFSGKEYTTHELGGYFLKGKVLIGIGMFYYMGIWVDKLIFWYSSIGVQIVGPFYTNPYYDTAMFLAYLSIIPSLAIFLVKVETSFYTYYNFYFK